MRVACGLGRGGDSGLEADCTDYHGMAMAELLYREETRQLIGFCLEIPRELGKGHDEVIYKDALVVELSRAQIPFTREKPYEVRYTRP
jgi:hypothetical protein